jgi:hypothetical protein
MFWGSSVIVFSIVLKIVPEKYYDQLQGWIVVDEDKDMSENDKLMQAYKTHAQGKIDPNMFKQQHPNQPINDDGDLSDGLNNSGDDGYPNVGR